MTLTDKELTNALVEIQFIQYHYRYEEEVANACEIIYKRIAEEMKANKNRK